MLDNKKRKCYYVLVGDYVDKILYELKDLDYEIINKINKTNKNIPIGITQVKIIEYLLKNSVAYQKDLEKNLNLSRATISCVLKTMEKNKLVDRTSNSLDARSKEVVLNQKLKSNLEQNMKKIKEIESLITKDIALEDLTIFYKVIKKMKENLRGEENGQIDEKF